MSNITTDTIGVFGQLDNKKASKEKPFTVRVWGHKVEICTLGSEANKALRNVARSPGYFLMATKDPDLTQAAESLYSNLSVKKYKDAGIQHIQSHLVAAHAKMLSNRQFDTNKAEKAEKAKKEREAKAEKIVPPNIGRNSSNSRLNKDPLATSPSTRACTDSKPSSQGFDSPYNDGMRSRASSVDSDDSVDSVDSVDSDDSVGSDDSLSGFLDASEGPAEGPEELPLQDRTAKQVAEDIEKALKKALGNATKTNTPTTRAEEIAKLLEHQGKE